MKEAILYKKLGRNLVQCQVCHHFCIIADGKRGFCGVRENKKGTLHSLNYDKVIAVQIDPIEKKPLFHFLPGSLSYSVSAVGCNFRCAQCQNWEISQISKLYPKDIPGKKITPEELVNEAVKNNCPSISYTYTEPTVFVELALETMKLAKKQGLKNNWVSNGYMSQETLKIVAPYLDAINVDLKFFDSDLYKKVCGTKLQPVLDSLKWIKKNKVWLEVTTLVVPGYTDIKNQFQKIAEFIKNELGSETPWHISRFYPTYKMTDLPATAPEIIYQACEIGKRAALKYVYAGNLLSDEKENTYCSKCNQLNIKRTGYQIERFDKNGKCKKCNQSIDLILS